MSALLELFYNRFIFMIIFVYSSRWPGLEGHSCPFI